MATKSTPTQEEKALTLVEERITRLEKRLSVIKATLDRRGEAISALEKAAKGEGA